MEEQEKIVNERAPLTWAYIGDAVFELYIREKLVENTKLKPHRLHIETVKYVKASAQAEILKQIKEHLTEEEQEIVRRTRNTKNHHLPKNANMIDYMYATAFEGLIGYLYLSRKARKIKRNFKLCIKRIK